MSDNPKTKAYWKRVGRLASELSCKASSPYPMKPVQEWLDDTVQQIDPKMPREMVLEAVKVAIKESERMATYYERAAGEYRNGIAELERFPGYRKPVVLRTIDGGRNV